MGADHRNVAFISNLMDSGVKFEAVDSPKANRLTVHVLAVVAEHEAQMISERTKAALRQKKRWYEAQTPEQLEALLASGKPTQLGGDRGYRPPEPPSPKEIAKATVVRQRKADHKAFAVLPVMEQLHGEGGVVSFNALAKRLKELSHEMPRGGAGTATAGKRALARVA